jgi:hypothetical protein
MCVCVMALSFRLEIYSKVINPEIILYDYFYLHVLFELMSILETSIFLCILNKENLKLIWKLIKAIYVIVYLEINVLFK